MKYNYDLNTRDGRQKFYQSSEWKALRRFMIAQNPLCELCIENEHIRAATDVHHKMDIADSPHLRLDMNNLQCLCKSCHDNITRARNVESKLLPGRPMWDIKADESWKER